MVNEKLEVIITKDFTDSDFENLKNKFTSEGITIKFKGIKRNKQGEIISIKIDVSSKKSNANYNIDGDEAISPIKITVGNKGERISIGNANIKNGKHLVFVSEAGNKHRIHESDSKNNVFVFSSSDEDKDDVEVEKFIIKNVDTLHIDKKHKMKTVDIDSDNDVIFITKDDKSKKIHKIVKIKASEEKNGLNWTTEDDHEDVKIISMDKSSNVEIISEKGKEAIYILDGKEITPKEMKDINPNIIDKVEVLKGDKATEVYGDKAKDGVVKITTKKKK